MRDELRKIQSGVLVSDKARNPGVGYFASYGQQTPKQDGSLSSTPDVTSPNMSATSAPLSRLGKDASSESLSLNEANASGSANNKEDEAINFEYLRNVIMQFLENKEMRVRSPMSTGTGLVGSDLLAQPHLVTVLGVILHFTPQELRRVSSKVNS